MLVRESPGRFTNDSRGYPKPKPKLNPGPCHIPPATSFPLDFFHLYFDIELMKLMVLNTNAVGAEIFAAKPKPSNGSKKGHWMPTSIGELYRLIAVLLHMGIKRLPSMRSYWS